MTGWSLGDDSVSDSTARSDTRLAERESSITGSGSFQVRKAHAFFVADDDSAIPPDPVPSSSRRKQPSERTRELVLDDAEDGDEDDDDRGSRSVKNTCSVKPVPAASVDTKELYLPVTYSSTNRRPDENDIPGVIHSRLRSKGSQSTASSNKKQVSLSEDTALDVEALMFYLVREFLSLHVANSAVTSLFETEQQHMKVLDEKSAKKMFQRVIGQNNAAPKESPTLLEQLVIVWDEATHKRRCERPVSPSTSSSSSSSSTSRRSSSSRSSEATVTTSSDVKKKSSSSLSIRKKVKPTLNVITATEELDDLDANHNGTSPEGDFNRLNRPGSTPKPQLLSSEVASILGDPGSTPKARAGELKALGFDEDELRTPVPVENCGSGSLTSSLTDSDDLDDISDYAKQKRIAKKHNKRVSLGVPGSTPTKEYIFFRETPPSYVTESVEAAVEVLEKLGLDPAFRLQAATQQERFIELQSSEVSKYHVGQEVRNLGAQRNISGVVSKIFGTRQCGTSGPGTIVIDTCPEETSGSASTATIAPMSVATRPGTPAAAARSSFSLDDEDFMDELVA